MIAGICSVYIAYNFFSGYLRKSLKFGYSDYVLYAAIAMSMTVSVIIFDNLFVLTLNALLLHLAMVFFSFEGSNIVRVVSAVVIVALGIFSEVLSASILMFFHNESVITLNDLNIFVTGVFLSKTSLFIIIKFVTRNRDFKVSQVSRKYVWLMISVPVVCFFIMLKVAYVYIVAETPDVGSFFAMLGILYIAIIFFVVLEEIIHKTEQNKMMQLEKAFYEVEKSHYEQLLDQREELNLIMHDMKNMMLSVEMHLNVGDVLGAMEVVKALRRDVDEKNAIKTGNPQLDILINSKMSRIVGASIVLETDIRLSEQLELDSVDMCVLIGNALDNAIEACERCVSDEKEIHMWIQTVKGHLAVVIKNSVNPDSLKLNNGEWLSSKRKEKKGFGIRSMKRIVESYGGNLISRLEEKYFTVEIVIPIEKMKS